MQIKLLLLAYIFVLRKLQIKLKSIKIMRYVPLGIDISLLSKQKFLSILNYSKVLSLRKINFIFRLFQKLLLYIFAY